ncbi:MAG TPA: hypothetical protein VER33_27025 [Polyangiaceae bacterium]|nr:hypothetical protein [Polyangiaceae bacterium]
MPRPLDLSIPDELPALEPDDETPDLHDSELGTLLDDLPELEEDAMGGEPVWRGELDTSDEDDVASGKHEPPTDDGAEATELDVGSDTDDLMFIEDGAEGDDLASGIDIEGHDALEPATELDPGDDAEGTTETSSSWISAELPPLDLGDDAEGIAAADELRFAAAFTDEPRPVLSARPWVELCPTLTLEACSALAAADGTLVAGSSDLLWFAPGELAPLRLDAGSAPIHSLALVGKGWEFAVCSTLSGRLMRRGRLAPAAEELRGLRELLDPASSPRDVVELCQPGTSFPHALLVRTSRGQLLRSDDDGSTFRAVSEHKVAALAPSGAPAIALTHEGWLLRSDDGGGSFVQLALPEVVKPWLLTATVAVSARGEIVALAEPELGVAVSPDGGRSFQSVVGTRGVTAIAACAAAQAGCTFAALYDEAHDCSFLLRIDAQGASMETLALIQGAGGEDEDSADWARVARLEWEPAKERLWAVGGFGVKVFAANASAAPSASAL